MWPNQNRRPKVFNRGIWVCAGGLDTLKIDKSQLIYTVSCCNLGGLEPCLGRLSPQKLPHGDGTGPSVCWICWSLPNLDLFSNVGVPPNQRTSLCCVEEPQRVHGARRGGGKAGICTLGNKNQKFLENLKLEA